LNETAYTPPRITIYNHQTAAFGMQADESALSAFAPLVTIKPEHGCSKVENEEDLLDAIVVVLTGNCSYFDKA